jgi:hypothetical protein
MSFLKILKIVFRITEEVSGSGRYPKVRTSTMSDRSRLHTQLFGNFGRNFQISGEKLSFLPK